LLKITKLALQKNPFQVEWIAILNQIEAKQKQKTNYQLVQCKKIIYPSKISEQTSSSSCIKSTIVSGALL
jgi:hypothetical protein